MIQERPAEKTRLIRDVKNDCCVHTIGKDNRFCLPT